MNWNNDMQANHQMVLRKRRWQQKNLWLIQFKRAHTDKKDFWWWMISLLEQCELESRFAIFPKNIGERTAMSDFSGDPQAGWRPVVGTMPRWRGARKNTFGNGWNWRGWRVVPGYGAGFGLKNLKIQFLAVNWHTLPQEKQGDHKTELKWDGHGKGDAAHLKLEWVTLVGDLPYGGNSSKLQSYVSDVPLWGVDRGLGSVPTVHHNIIVVILMNSGCLHAGRKIG
jgi:hypothetical protein